MTERDRLIRDHDWVVLTILKRQGKHPAVRRYGLDDIAGIAWLELVKAADGYVRYARREGVAFSTYAWPRVETAVVRAAHDGGLIHKPDYLNWADKADTDKAAQARRVAAPQRLAPRRLAEAAAYDPWPAVDEAEWLRAQRALLPAALAALSYWERRNRGLKLAALRAYYKAVPDAAG